ncbi:MAG TPA: hypothetical protein VGK38_06315, partial [Prolixibacteraceae bacterium]
AIINEPNVTNEEIGRFRNGGEIHQWMYDRYSLRKLLIQAGFDEVVVQTANGSNITDWQKYCLDTDSNNTVYKADSLYMEGIKI